MRTNKVIWTLLACLAVAGIGAAVAGETAEKVKLEGWVVDSYCGAGNANAEGKDCIVKCHKDGADLVFVVGDKTYKLSDQKAALEHVGYKVQVVGTLENENTIKVAEFVKPDKKA